MTREGYLNEILTQYDVVKILSSNNGNRILRLRHKKQGKDIVVRSYPKPVLAYQELKSIAHQNISTVYDSLLFEDGQIVLEEFVNGITVAQVLEQGN